MKQNIDKIKTIIRDFTDVLAKEKSAIGNRALDKIAEFSVIKAALLDEFDALAASMNENETTDELIEQLNAMRTQAEENAQALNAITKGVRQARSRLQSIKEADRRTGTYGPDGKTVLNPDAATISAKA